jgi:membrane protein required for colicin V production
MSTIDIILAIFLSYFVFKGYTNGLIISLATLAGLILGFWGASYFSEFTADWLQDDLGLKSGNIRLIAYVVTFIIVMVLVFLLGRFLTGVVKTAGLGIVNRLAGVLFGICKGLILASFLFLALSHIDPKERLLTAEHKKDSVSYKQVSAIAPVVIPLLKKYTAEVQEFLK